MDAKMQAGNSSTANNGRSSPMVHFWAGWAGASISCVLLSPLEVVKTRLQSTLAADNRLRPDKLALHIVRTEGITGLYRGLVPHLLGVGPSRAFYFGAYNFIKRTLGKGDENVPGRSLLSGTTLHLTAAIIASIASATIMSPVWVVKTRLQLQQTPQESISTTFQRMLAGTVTGSVQPTASVAVVGTAAGSHAVPMSALNSAVSGAERPYRGIGDAFVRIYREEGVRAFYRGMGASYLGVIETALQFAVYESLKADLVEGREETIRQGIARGERPFGLDRNSSSSDIRRAAYSDGVAFATSAASKLLAAVITYPHEVIRTRLREQRGWAGEGLKYKGVLHAVRSIYAAEGLAGLYGGMSVHLLRTVPNAAILLMVVERIVGGEV